MPLNFQLTCPRLERATLLLFPIGRTNIQWDNLSHLTLHSMSIIDSFLILCKTPRLVFCSISDFCKPYTGPTMGVLVLPSLQSLKLISWSFAEEYLNTVIAPHLEEFRVPSYCFTLMKTITSFLQRSACPLHSFSIVFGIFPTYFEHFMDLLQILPSLNRLSITSLSTSFEDSSEDHDPRSILQLVAKVLSSQSTSPQAFLPSLKILEYSRKLYLGSGNYIDFYSLPPANNAVHGPLHLLQLNLHPVTRIPKNMISYLSSLVERGITVKVLSNSEDILKFSIDYYRCRNDSLGQDWTDNFDSSLFLDF